MVASLVVCHTLTSVIVLEVGDIFPTTMPSNLLSFAFLLWVNKNFHSFIVQTLRLKEVKHVEFDFLALTSILNTKVEPLRVTFRVYIILQNQIVFLLRLLLRKLKVTAFKSALKDQSSVLKWFWNIILTARSRFLRKEWDISPILLHSLIFSHVIGHLSLDLSDGQIHISWQTLHQALYITCSNQLRKAIWAKFFICIIIRLPKSTVNDWIFLTK